MKKFRQIASAGCVALLLLAGITQAQSVKETNQLNLGIGIGTFGFSGTGGVPIVLSYEHGFTDEISAGGFLSFIKRKFYDDYTYTYFLVGAKGSYHLGNALNIENERLDVYGGASIFYRGFKVNYKGDYSGYGKTSGGNLGVGIHAGGRYAFNKSVGGFAELGYGISPLQLGVSLKF